MNTDPIASAKLRQILERRSIQIPECGCRLWMGYADRKNYGQLLVEGKAQYAHRLAYALYRSVVPAGMHVLHKCDVPLCINPDHLFLGTNQENILDSVKKGRRKGIKRNRPTGLHYKLKSTSHDCKRKIKKAEWPEIIRLLDSGLRQIDVANKYEVSDAVICRIAARCRSPEERMLARAWTPERRLAQAKRARIQHTKKRSNA